MHARLIGFVQCGFTWRSQWESPPFKKVYITLM